MHELAQARILVTNRNIKNLKKKRVDYYFTRARSRCIPLNLPYIARSFFFLLNYAYTKYQRQSWIFVAVAYTRRVNKPICTMTTTQGVFLGAHLSGRV